MRAMDAELARSRPGDLKQPTQHDINDKGKGKEKESDADIEAAMEAELKEYLHAGMDEDDTNADLGDEAGVDYNLIKNFLESFKSQAGMSGPVSNLAGRLRPGWIPKDSS